MVDVTIAIATFRRPKGLKRLLDAIAKLQTNANVFVLVADNDAFHSEGYELCRRLCIGYRWPLDSFVVSRRGIAQARNALALRALQRTDMSYLAMLDDDGAPEPGWLDAMLHAQNKTDADVVGGLVVPAFEIAPPPWAARAPGIAPRHHRTGPIPMLHGTGNTLFTRAAIERAGYPLFDPGYALTGGEDKELFTRMKRQGARYAWCDEAVIRETQPASRLTVGWYCRRAYRVGNSDMRVFLRHRRTAAALVPELAKIAAALLSAPFMSLIFAFAPNRRLDGLRLICRQAGKVAALFGRHYHEYAVTHGR
jgi:glycosyltransferase involved in cell wall biosynthesis